MRTDSRLAVRVGIFFTIAVILALGMSLQVGKLAIFSNEYEVIANFREAKGIEPGTRVTLRGVPIGNVKSMDWDASAYRVRTVLRIQDRYEIPANGTAKIEISSLLGGSVVNISVEEGPEEVAVLRNGDRIETREAPNIDEILETVGSLGTKAESMIASLDENQRATMGKIQAVIDENRESIRNATDSMSRMGPKLEAVAGRMDRMTEFMESGQGTLGQLYANEQLYKDLVDMSSTAKEVAAQIKSGEGALGSLIYSDDLTKDAKALIADLQKAAREVEAAIGENRENLRTLVNALSESGPKIQQTLDNLNQVAAKINQGDGTLGKLVNDPSLYQDAQRTVNQVGESFESSEEQGVFRSFLGLVFGALI